MNIHPCQKALLSLLLLALPSMAAAQATRADDLRYPPLPAFEIPQPERVVLDNGMVVMLLEDHELPLIEATALVHAGSRFDPADKVGLAELGADGDMVRASLSSLKADFPQVLRIFADVLRRPAFDAGKLEVVRNQAI